MQIIQKENFICTPEDVKKALEEHRAMWKAMQEELGDNPSLDERQIFKAKYCSQHNLEVPYNCILCDFYRKHSNDPDEVGHIFLCSSRCLIDWDYGRPFTFTPIDYGCQKGRHRMGHVDYEMDGMIDWRYSPISKILALPVRDIYKEVLDGKTD